MYICTVTTAHVNICKLMHPLVWVFFWVKCVNLDTFSITHYLMRVLLRCWLWVYLHLGFFAWFGWFLFFTFLLLWILKKYLYSSWNICSPFVFIFLILEIYIYIYIFITYIFPQFIRNWIVWFCGKNCGKYMIFEGVMSCI